MMENPCRCRKRDRWLCARPRHGVYILDAISGWKIGWEIPSTHLPACLTEFLLGGAISACRHRTPRPRVFVRYPCLAPYRGGLMNPVGIMRIMRHDMAWPAMQCRTRTRQPCLVLAMVIGDWVVGALTSSPPPWRENYPSTWVRHAPKVK